MARAGDDTHSDVHRYEAQGIRFCGAERFFPAQGQDRNRQPTNLCKQRFVIDGVLIERTELLESVVHRVRSRVQRGVVLSRCIADAFGIGGQFVIKAIEIDTLAAGN